MLRPAALALALALGGCASPLYTQTPTAMLNEMVIPRDDRGEPILSEIKPGPAAALAAAAPVPPPPLPSGPR